MQGHRCPGGFRIGSEAVSYTHLDVYKRQHMNKEEAHEKALELLDKVGLKDKADVYPSTLSVSYTHLEFTALFVETPDFSVMSEENVKRLRSNIRLAEQLGAKIETVYGEDVSFQIAEFTRLSGCLLYTSRCV